MTFGSSLAVGESGDSVADFDEVSIWIPEIHRHQLSNRTCFLCRPLDDLYVVRPKLGDHIFNRQIGQDTKIAAAWHGSFRKAGQRFGILDADFTCSEMKRPFACSFLACLQTKDALIELKRNLHVADAKDNVVETIDVHS